MWQRITLFRMWLAAGVVVVPIVFHFIGQQPAIVYVAGYINWVLLYVVGKWLYHRSERKADIRSAQQWQQQLTAFKQKATVINVPLHQCDILTNNYVVEHDGYHKPVMAGFNITSAQQNSNISRQAVLRSQIIFEHNGVRYASPVLPIAKESLLFIFDKQKETKLYVDTTKGYYFDLEFLNA